MFTPAWANPDCRFIFIARNPLRRIESSYREMHHSGVKFGLNAPYGLADNLQMFPQMIKDSLFFERISKYLQAFGRDSVQVIFLEDLKANPQLELEKCFRHLGVDSRFRAQRAQPFVHPEAQTAAAMHRGAGRFVQHQDMVILIKDNVTEGSHFLQLRRNRFFFAFGDANRRNAHFVAGFELVLRFDTLFINPHLALAQDAINHTLWHTFQLGAQKVIDALPRFIISDSNHFYGWGLCFHGWRF